jgi:hypothetical protein
MASETGSGDIVTGPAADLCSKGIFRKASRGDRPRESAPAAKRARVAPKTFRQASDCVVFLATMARSFRLITNQ